MILVTGGSGFIGANFIHHWLTRNEEGLLNLDNLSYAANQDNLSEISSDKRYSFVKGSITDLDLVAALLNENEPRALINFAAESHVDRSIDSPKAFIYSNIIGTYNLLESTRKHFKNLNLNRKSNFRFHHISTDEVFGSLDSGDQKFNEESITELAIIRFSDNRILDQFSTLINPLKEIQPFVQKLTGINSNMVKNAPKFYEVAKRVIEITKGCVLVAHNSNFDYRILKIEFDFAGVV